MAVVLLVAGGIYLWSLPRADQTNSDSAQTEAPISQKKKTPETKPARPKVNLQPVLDSWLKDNNGTYSVVMRDLDGSNIVAAHNDDTQYFMASIYKLYVAYLALIDVQNNKYDLSESFLNGWSRQKCIDQMIRISHSPCGEKYMAEQGREVIKKRLAEFNIIDTDYGAFVTTAADAEQVLHRLHAGKDLDDAHAKILLDAMKGQIYRDTIVKGVKEAKVANKVGFRGYEEYHDVGIIYMPSGAAYSLSILTKNAGTSRIADLVKTLTGALPN
jgi:beta-lactamase class A